jgi:expansin (peptidoglycan-binding protein)
MCRCPTGLTSCNNACVNTSNDLQNCGACNAPCATTCANGVCQSTTNACHFPTSYQTGNGSVTFYYFKQGSSAVNCSYAPIHIGADVNAANGNVTDYDSVPHVSTGGGSDFGAMNTADYNNAATCGACAEVTRDGSRKVVVTIVDQCPSGGVNSPCKAGHIDLSWHAFQQIGAFSEGYLGTGNGGAVGSISWRYVPCPVTENVSYVIKQPNTGGTTFNQVLLQGHRTPLVKVEVNISGNWVNAVRQSYNYWDPGNWPSGVYSVRATDTAGAQITGSVDLSKTGDQTSSAQFPVCQ